MADESRAGDRAGPAGRRHRDVRDLILRLHAVRLALLILGIAYMLFARRWLAAKPEGPRGAGRPTFRDWIEQYQLADREYRLRVSEGRR